MNISQNFEKNIDRASVISSAINPCGALLAKWNDNIVVRYAAIALTSVDYIIQVVAATLWIAYDDIRSSSTLGDYAFMIVRVPSKMLVIFFASLLAQLGECYNKARETRHSNGEELQHIYLERWKWLREDEISTVSLSDKIKGSSPNKLQVCEPERQLALAVSKNMPDRPRFDSVFIQVSNYPEMRWLFFAEGDGPFGDHAIRVKGDAKAIKDIFENSMLITTHPVMNLNDQANVLWGLDRKCKQPSKNDCEDWIPKTYALIIGPYQWNNVKDYGILPKECVDKLRNGPDVSNQQ